MSAEFASTDWTERWAAIQDRQRREAHWAFWSGFFLVVALGIVLGWASGPIGSTLLALTLVCGGVAPLAGFINRVRVERRHERETALLSDLARVDGIARRAVAGVRLIQEGGTATGDGP